MTIATTLKAFPGRVWSFAWSHKKTSVAALIVIAIFAVVFMRGGSDVLAQETIEARVGSVVQEVSVTGRVKAAQAVDLSFERSGKIVSVPVAIGSVVRHGQLLVQLDTSELSAQRQQALAGVAAAQARYDQLAGGADVAATQASVTAAERSLREAVSSATSTVVNSLVTLTDVQFTYFNNTYPESIPVAEAKARALQELYGEPDLGRVGSWYFLQLTPETQLVSDITVASQRIADVLTSVGQALDALTNALSQTTASAADKATVISAKSAVQAQAASLVQAQNSLASAQAQLDLKLAGGGSSDRAVAQAQLDQAKAQLALIDAQLTAYSIRAPFSGTVTALDATRGELATPGVPAVSVMGTAALEIDATIAEADIAKIHVGDAARVTLDAFGSDTVFAARVVHVDPAGTVMQGVATYKVTLQFTEDDDRILAGLTADVDIDTARRDDVVYAPTRNIITDSGEKFVRVLVSQTTTDVRFANLEILSENETDKIVQVPVTLGLRGSDGRTEITSGLSAGDVIVVD